MESFRYTAFNLALMAPYQPGVYYLLDSRGKVIYVSSTGNLKKSLIDLFYSGLITGVKFFNFQVCNDSVEMDLIEKLEINRLKPKYNLKGAESRVLRGLITAGWKI